ADLNGAILIQSDLSGAKLFRATFTDADLSGAKFIRADLRETDLSEANLSGAMLMHADLRWAKLSRARLIQADLSAGKLFKAKLKQANLSGAGLIQADLREVDLREANLSGATLYVASVVDTDLTDANLTGCRIYGMSAWKLILDGAKQTDLVITPPQEPEITVDNIEVAQFMYLLLHSDNIREVIDTITSKVVLILGRFMPERALVLYTLREELRKRNYLPVVFYFEKPPTQTTDETITLLARMARFVIADISDDESVLRELRGFVPDLPSVAVQPLIRTPQEEPGMFDFLRKYPWVLEAHCYDNEQQLIADLGEHVIRPAEAKVLELRRQPLEPSSRFTEATLRG
ncbi:MAG: pentapeptide repeat-containing protein, partial [Acetobacteraceae bacterium]|nr:pentapeptide repeat-containing protein [Acetobacteraceae bacterium]